VGVRERVRISSTLQRKMVFQPKSSAKSRSRVRVLPAEYRALAEFRHQLAGFLRRRRQAAESVGLEAQQYELLLAVRGLPNGKQPTVKQLAEQLQIQHHSAVELASRLARRGLLRRERSPEDRRAVFLTVTKAGEKLVDQVVHYSFQQLKDEAPALLRTLGKILKARVKDSRR
jgi:DNA-binding MarR family transcriptional regulator